MPHPQPGAVAGGDVLSILYLRCAGFNMMAVPWGMAVFQFSI